MTPQAPPNWIIKLVDQLCTLPAKDLTNLVGTQAIRDAIGEALEKYTRTEDHARRTVDRLMDLPWRPTRAQIREAAESTPVDPPPALRPANPDCKACGGSGWKIIERGGLSGAAMCECRKVGTVSTGGR